MKRNLMTWGGLPTATLVFCALAYSGCSSPTTDNGPMPADAYSASGEALPPGFAPFTGTETEWNQLKSEGSLVPFTPAQNEQDSNTAQQQDLNAQGTITAFLLLHPELKGKISQLVDPSVLDDDFARRINLRLEGGIYLQDLIGKDQKSHTIGLLGDNFKRQILAGGLDAFNPNKAARSSAKVYEHFYNFMVKDPRFSDFIGRFKKPSEVYALNNVGEVVKEIDKFQIVYQFPGGFLNLDPRPAPQNEIGFGSGGDRSSSSCATASSTGVIGSSYNFPLKYYVTSVKEQGSRGSCVAFGVTGALETAWARDTGQYVNLSEQDLYYHMKGYWWPAGDSYGDGSDSHAIFDKMASLGTDGYYMPYENQWDYNPSWSRTEDDDNCGKTGHPACTRKYTHSCDSYDETCSNTNHQGGAYCFDISGWNYCGYTGRVFSTNQQVRAAGDAELWNMADTNGSFAWTLIGLYFKSPMVAGIAVPPSFDSVDPNGYVHYVGSGEKSRGGHAVEVVGFVDDQNLPAGAPKAGDAGGNGYFIIKNSWGTCYGDTGFYYLPYQWMRDYAYSMVVLNGISHK